jgi:hypothetical protein
MSQLLGMTMQDVLQDLDIGGITLGKLIATRFPGKEQQRRAMREIIRSFDTYRNTENEIGNRYGYFTILEHKGSDNSGHSMWLARCSCGTEKVVRLKELKRGNTKSCGCFRRGRRAEF